MNKSFTNLSPRSSASANFSRFWYGDALKSLIRYFEMPKTKIKEFSHLIKDVEHETKPVVKNLRKVYFERFSPKLDANILGSQLKIEALPDTIKAVTPPPSDHEAEKPAKIKLHDSSTLKNNPELTTVTIQSVTQSAARQGTSSSSASSSSSLVIRPKNKTETLAKSLAPICRIFSDSKTAAVRGLSRSSSAVSVTDLSNAGENQDAEENLAPNDLESSPAASKFYVDFTQKLDQQLRTFHQKFQQIAQNQETINNFLQNFETFHHQVVNS